jgi:DNA invertase Pin-like site-specific DNA recombinase
MLVRFPQHEGACKVAAKKSQPKAYSYIRFSSQVQETNRSVSRQTDLTKHFCTRHNLDLDHNTILDKAVSAWKGKNITVGALSEFLRLVDDGRIAKGSYLVIEKLDRLSRDDVSKILPVFTNLIESGIIIATTDPERIYTKDCLKGFAILEVIMHFILANEESAKKSERSRYSWAKKRQNASKEKITPICPAWLKLQNNRFVLIPDAVATLKLIFKLAAEGNGYHSITTYLTRNNIAPIGIVDTWCQSYVQKLMKDRRLLGELATYSLDESGKRQPTGDVIKDYYPPIIKPEQFYAVQQLINHRKHHHGRIGKNGEANLFTGLLVDARTKSVMRITAKKTLASGASLNKRNTVFAAFKYQFIEYAILLTLKEVIPLLATNVPKNKQADVDKIRSKIGKAQDQMASLKAKLKKSYSETLVELLLETEQELKVLKAQEIKLLGEATVNVQQDIKYVTDMLVHASIIPQPEFRTKLKAAISRVMDTSYVLNGRSGGKRTSIVQLHLKGMDTYTTISIWYNTFHKECHIDYLENYPDLRNYKPTEEDDALLAGRTAKAAAKIK